MFERLTCIDVENRGRHIVGLLGSLRSGRDSALEAPGDAIPARRASPRSPCIDQLGSPREGVKGRSRSCHCLVAEERRERGGRMLFRNAHSEWPKLRPAHLFFLLVTASAFKELHPFTHSQLGATP